MGLCRRCCNFRQTKITSSRKAQLDPFCGTECCPHLLLRHVDLAPCMILKMPAAMWCSDREPNVAVYAMP